MMSEVASNAMWGSEMQPKVLDSGGGGYCLAHQRNARQGSASTDKGDDKRFVDIDDKATLNAS